jgi:prolipoprotein diacylglyceryltransferase
METPLHILFVINPANLFGLIYATTLVLGIVYFAFSGFRQKYPTGSWVAITASVLVLFVIGIKVFVYTPVEWVRILMGTHHDIAYIKYVPGGILLVALGILLLKRFLGFRASVFDGFVLFLPLLGAFQRVGCFLNGCCYGTQTELPWAVKYSWPST